MKQVVQAESTLYGVFLLIGMQFLRGTMKEKINRHADLMMTRPALVLFYAGNGFRFVGWPNKYAKQCLIKRKQ